MGIEKQIEELEKKIAMMAPYINGGKLSSVEITGSGYCEERWKRIDSCVKEWISKQDPGFYDVKVSFGFPWNCKKQDKTTLNVAIVIYYSSHDGGSFYEWSTSLDDIHSKYSLNKTVVLVELIKEIF